MDNAQELIQRLNHSGKKLSKSHRRIAECIVSHYDKAAFMTASRLGEYVGVSESTVVRFASALGYDGYPQLQRALQELAKTHLTAAQRMAVADNLLQRDNVLDKVLLGDAGSRFLGLLVGVGVLVTGNPVLVFAVAPIVLVNGGGGLGKLVLLRTLKKFGMEVRHPSVLTELEQAAQSPFVRIIHSVRFPLHDHCTRILNWSTAQVLMRFMLLQAFLTPLLFILFVKVR